MGVGGAGSRAGGDRGPETCGKVAAETRGRWDRRARFSTGCFLPDAVRKWDGQDRLREEIGRPIETAITLRSPGINITPGIISFYLF